MMMIFIFMMYSINYVTVEATYYSGPGVVVDSCTCHESGDVSMRLGGYFLTQCAKTLNQQKHRLWVHILSKWSRRLYYLSR